MGLLTSNLCAKKNQNQKSQEKEKKEKKNKEFAEAEKNKMKKIQVDCKKKNTELRKSRNGLCEVRSCAGLLKCMLGCAVLLPAASCQLDTQWSDFASTSEVLHPFGAPCKLTGRYAMTPDHSNGPQLERDNSTGQPWRSLDHAAVQCADVRVRVVPLLSLQAALQLEPHFGKWVSRKVSWPPMRFSLFQVWLCLGFLGEIFYWVFYWVCKWWIPPRKSEKLFPEDKQKTNKRRTHAGTLIDV